MYPVVNLGLLFADLPWRRRFAAAAETGYDRVEFPWPPLPPAEVTRLVRVAGVRVELLNMDAGDLAAGDRGYGNDPRQVARWRGQLRRALALARELDCPLVNVLAGRLLPGIDEAEQVRCLTANLDWAATVAHGTGRTLVLEPINDRDIPGYLLPRVADVLAVLAGPDRERIRLQFDAYHVAAMGDDAARTAATAGPRIGHVQLADFPGRHEPGTGEIDVAALLAALDAAGYDGGIGLEYVPSGPTAAGLRAVARRHPRLAPTRPERPGTATRPARKGAP